MAKLLIIEDERDIVQALEYNLKKEGYSVSKAYDGIQGLKLIKDLSPDLIILDLMLPGVDGLEICRQVKKDPKTENLPVIMLTAKGAEADKVVGLEVGADDYIVKPFSMRELIARVRAVLKRYGKKIKETASLIKFPDLTIDSEKHEVKAAGKIIELTAKEFALLKFLAENQGRVFSREQLLDQVWGIEAAIETRTVDVHMRRLREKLGKAGKHLITLRGVGYKFV
jgi:two-component system alkaline phosphatase synthesis response regulator PhoP